MTCRRLAVIAALLALRGPIADATSFFIPPFPETVQKSEIIVRGTAGMSYAKWDEVGGDRRIYTYTELEVSEILKGAAGGSRDLIVRQPGGEKDGIAMEVSGTARFRRGEEVVLMLKAANPDGSHDVRSLMVGKLELKPDPDGRDEILVGPALSEAGVTDDRVGHNDTDLSQSSDGKWTLQRLRELIRSQGEVLEEAQKGGRKEETAKDETAPAEAEEAAPPLQPRTEGGENPKESPETKPGSQGLTLTVIGYALAALFAFGVILFFILRGKRG